MTPTERADLRRKCHRYKQAPAASAEQRNLQAMLAAAVPGLLDETDRLERRAGSADEGADYRALGRAMREWP